MEESMWCPVCDSIAYPTWESRGAVNGGHWFVGLYTCKECGHFKASGTIRDGKRKVVQWHPACPLHGTDPVHLTMAESHDFMTHDTEWTCSACHRRMAVVDGKLVTTWQPYQPVWLEQSVVDAAMQRIGGLPHD